MSDFQIQLRQDFHLPPRAEICYKNQTIVFEGEHPGDLIWQLAIFSENLEKIISQAEDWRNKVSYESSSYCFLLTKMDICFGSPPQLILSCNLDELSQLSQGVDALMTLTKNTYFA